MTNNPIPLWLNISLLVMTIYVHLNVFVYDIIFAYLAHKYQGDPFNAEVELQWENDFLYSQYTNASFTFSYYYAGIIDIIFGTASLCFMLSVPKGMKIFIQSARL